MSLMVRFNFRSNTDFNCPDRVACARLEGWAENAYEYPDWTEITVAKINEVSRDNTWRTKSKIHIPEAAFRKLYEKTIRAGTVIWDLTDDAVSAIEQDWANKTGPFAPAAEPGCEP